MNSKYKVLKFNSEKFENIDDLISIEEPLEISVKYKDKDIWITQSLSITMRTPGHDEDLVRGFLFNEQIIENINDIDSINSVSVTGGNGSGCVLQPVVGIRNRFIDFDSRNIFFNGGIDIVNETITFKNQHNLENGQLVYYSSNGNPPIGVGSFGNNAVSPVGLVKTTIVNSGVYWPKVVNTTTIKLYQKEDDYNAGINTVGFTTANKIGTHITRES